MQSASASALVHTMDSATDALATSEAALVASQRVLPVAAMFPPVAVVTSTPSSQMR